MESGADDGAADSAQDAASGGTLFGIAHVRAAARK